MVGVDEVLADFNVSLVNQDSCLMDGFGLEAFLIDSGLESFVEEFVQSETQDVIEFEFFVGQESVPMHSI